MQASEAAMRQELQRRAFWAEHQEQKRRERPVSWREQQMQDKAGQFSAPPGHPANIIRGICLQKHAEMRREEEAHQRAEEATRTPETAGFYKGGY